MARTVKLQDRFQRGMIRDLPRDRLPENAAYNLVDLIPDMGSALRKRGGYAYQSNDIAAVTATAAYVIGGLYAEFAAAAKNLALDEDGRIYSIAANGTVTDIGAAVTVAQNPVFHRDKAIIPCDDGTTAPKYYDGTTLGNLGGSPPAGVWATVYKDRTVLARSDANLERLWFSDPGDPAGWDTTNTYWDSSHPVTGLHSLRNAILIFSNGHTERLRGSIPPPGSDMTLDPLFEVGCTDARSISPWGDNVLFANPGGIYITDGSALDDLTLQAGMKRYWQELLASYASTWTLVGGVYQNYYLIAVMDGSTFKDAALIDIPRRAWHRLSNWKARSMWRAVKEAEELYFGLRSAARVAKTSTIFTPSGTVKNDGDGTAVTYTYESPFFMDRPGKKTWKAIYVSFDLRDAASDNPAVTLSYQTTPEGSYTAVSPTFTETTDFSYQRRRINVPAHGLGLKLVQANASSESRIYGLQADVHARELSRVA